MRPVARAVLKVDWDHESITEEGKGSTVAAAERQPLWLKRRRRVRKEAKKLKASAERS